MRKKEEKTITVGVRFRLQIFELITMHQKRSHS